MAKFSIEAKVGMNYNAVSFKPAYWFSLALVAAAGSASYIFQHHLIYKKLAAEKKNERININIITNNKSAVAKNK
ncbi:MAG: hypothetical protein EOO43_08300 [Flavobacterium sp.]|nr:MAG: hypothetical protein EOO43_08300 [Flavobacterium sp.]